MLPLYLLAAHLVGDFVFQTRWQADGKFGWSSNAVLLRVTHCASYCLAFLPVVAWANPLWWQVAGFFATLYALHFLTDSRRFTSTIGDVVGWRFRSLTQRQAEWSGQPMYGKVGTTSDSRPPNPWPTLPLAIDQTLHVVQVAVLAGLFL